ncbi:GNAT family N-acetyltransferase [Larkinella terrae]|uniref:GNAT family N-acetyltransferase n=1 Tax=Larkinella terrae TaxID=2025311 RepID=A0A7K0EM93_9BACT|nr:GNAT family protein [Larkinella terrae]MRS62929.1 GNAT family N-acetyltransferase [Larkinella terrae]
MELLPIKATLDENAGFQEHPECETSLAMTVDFFNRIGYQPPWIGYYARENGELVGSAAFKGAPKNGRVEIAYGTFPQFQRQGIASEMCRKLVLLAQQTDPAVTISARTFEPGDESSRVLQRNGFVGLGTVWDEEDGAVWEWEYRA